MIHPPNDTQSTKIPKVPPKKRMNIEMMLYLYPIPMGSFLGLPKKCLGTDPGSSEASGQLIGTSTFKERWSSVFPVFGLYVPGQSVAVDFQAAVPN